MKKKWGSHAGADVYLFSLVTEDAEVQLINFGAIIVGIWLRDQNGNRRNIVLGYDNLPDYIDDQYYIGCTVGRVAGRVSTSGFVISDRRHELTDNTGNGIHLHGGREGFGKKVFEVIDFSDAHLTLKYYSKDGEEGYPGNLNFTVKYRLDKNRLTVIYEAVSDHDTHINITNHSYFNFNSSGPIDNHLLQIHADKLVETDEEFIPTGRLLAVKNTPFSFLQTRELGSAPFNTCYVLSEEKAATLALPASGLRLQVKTDCPGLLLYTGDYLAGRFSKRSGVCLETQYFPDAPNRPEFSGTLLRAGERWKMETQYVFGREKGKEKREKGKEKREKGKEKREK